MSKPITTIVTIPGMISPADWQLLDEKSEVRYIEHDKLNEDELIETIKDSDYLMLNRDVVDSLEESFYKKVAEQKLPLKAISTDITGMTWANPEVAAKYNMPLMNTPNYSTVSVAEFSLAALLVLVKRMDLVWQDRLAGKKEEPHKNDVLVGKTIGIVGLGNIGSKLAQLLQGFEARIVAWNRSPKELVGVEQLSLEEVLSQSDYLSIHLKTTNDTQGMFDGKLLSHCKHGQMIINEADSKLVDTQAVLEALESGQIGGYATSNSGVAGTPLENHPRVLAFPSQAWFTDHSLDLLRKIWVGNVISFIDGQPQNVLSKG